MNRRVAMMALSGGMDSTSLMMRLLADDYEVHTISFDYGQKHKVELQRAQANLAYLEQHGHHVRHNMIDLTSAMSTLHSALTDDSMAVPEGHYEEEQSQTVTQYLHPFSTPAHSLLPSRRESMSKSLSVYIRGTTPSTRIADHSSMPPLERPLKLVTGIRSLCHSNYLTSMATRRPFCATQRWRSANWV